MQNDNDYRPDTNPQPLPQGFTPQTGQSIYPPNSQQVNNQTYAAQLQQMADNPGLQSRPVISSSFVSYILIALATVLYFGSVLTGFYVASWVFSAENPGYEVALLVGAIVLALLGLIMTAIKARQKMIVSHVLAMIVGVFVLLSSINSLTAFIVYQVSSDFDESLIDDGRSSEVLDDESGLPDPSVEEFPQ